MPTSAEFNEPAYISSHSADVILSDIRPFKLKADALRSINLLLDEFLYNVLSSSGSLSTDRLRASLLGLLPTSLGKEALLEAEVELRAYWERTAPAGVLPSLEDDSATFHLPWTFELLRNKCEAYSTLNESDEDPAVEGKINEKFSRLGATAPRVLLVAPAALYLTAIIEAVCEHILSNVGRVAARDSSRASATVNDLFTALCEDASVYGYFKTTKVYGQIEQLSKAPKSKRNPSVSHGRSNSNARQSSEAPPTTPAPRSSFDKSRALRMFANGKTSIENQDSQSGHKKSASMTSDGLRNGSLNEADMSSVEDAAMLQEFDDLMRSASTMKVSLTPDRLRTMEVYKHEKEQRGGRCPVPLAFKPEPESQTSSRSSHKLPKRQVDSIVEDEEENLAPKSASPTSRARQASAASPPPLPQSNLNNLRIRSISTSSAGASAVPRKLTRSPSTTMPSSFPAKVAALTTSSSASNLHTSYTRDARPRGMTESGLPPRTRVKQRNRESLDLDDVMGGSDDDTPLNPPGLQPRAPASPKRVPKVSSTTRELMDFLAEGPPDSRGPGPVSREGKQLVDFLSEGPPTYGNNGIAVETKPKTGRLQRMISKLNIGDKQKVVENPLKTPVHRSHPSVGFGAPPTPQANGLASLANRPIPPRPPRPPQPISPPSSPSQVSLAEDKSVKSRQVPASGAPPLPPTGVPNGATASPRPKVSTLPAPAHPAVQEVGPAKAHAPYPNGDANVKSDRPKESPPQPQSPPAKLPSVVQRKPVPNLQPAVPNPPVPPIHANADKPSSGGISETEARDMQRLIASATSSDECRLIVDMFLTRAGISSTHSKTSDVASPYPSPPPSMNKYPQSALSDSTLEVSVVDLFLGGSVVPIVPPRSSRRHRTPKGDERVYENGTPPPNAPTPVHSHETTDRQIPAQDVFAERPSVQVTTWRSPAEFPTHAHAGVPITAAS